MSNGNEESGGQLTWSNESAVAAYLERSASNPHRLEGEQRLLEAVPASPVRVADLGAGDGRLAALVLHARPCVREVVALDSSPAMLRRAAERFRTDSRVSIVDCDLSAIRLAASGPFDMIVSGFAIHHLEDSEKGRLLVEVAAALSPGGVFANLDVVPCATPALHEEFLAEIGRPADDPEDRLAAVDDQLDWMRAAGLQNVGCTWRWKGFALLTGSREVGSSSAH
jgi:ubiquinone/menaquinone biosynthesis C-methylase UbiE